MFLSCPTVPAPQITASHQAPELRQQRRLPAGKPLVSHSAPEQILPSITEGASQ